MRPSKTTTTIQIPANTKYLSEVLSELPHNCIFDKGMTGCGGSTIAINSSHQTIIAVPFTSLIENKCYQHPNLIPVYGDDSIITNTEILRHLSNQSSEPIKIMTTYDSLLRVISCLEEAGHAISDYNLLIDEYHLLFTQYSFRESAVSGVLSSFDKFRSFCFMTATQLEPDFILQELDHIDIVIADWEESREIIVTSSYCSCGADKAAVELINRFITGEETGNAYIFVNSVSLIKKLVKACGLKKTNTNVIFSKANKAYVGMPRGILPSDKSGTIPPKKINLLTSCMFEGADIYDEGGKTFVISDGARQNTLIDISTSFQQIAGRIRNSKYWSSITHFYTESRHISLTMEQFKEDIDTEIDVSTKLITHLNTGDLEVRTSAADSVHRMYIESTPPPEAKFYINTNLIKLALYNFKVTKHTYRLQTHINTEYAANGYLIDTITDYSSVDISKATSGINKLKEVVLRLKKLDDEVKADITKVYDKGNMEYRNYYYNKYPFLEAAINTLGYDEIGRHKYIITNIKRAMISESSSTMTMKISRLLGTYSALEPGNFVAAKDLKGIIEKVYSKLKIKKAAKGSDISEYYRTRTAVIKVKGVSVKGVVIIGQVYAG